MLANVHRPTRNADFPDLELKQKKAGGDDGPAGFQIRQF
jgi:hypothetical protein